MPPILAPVSKRLNADDAGTARLNRFPPNVKEVALC
jgi:hypothetical protein